MSSNAVPNRVASIDAYRGFTMLAMISGGLGMAKLLADPNWHWLADQFTHREWVGCTFWDLIQPSFMFLVGVSMPIAFGIRQDQGATWREQFSHAWKRALVLVMLGIILDSMGKTEPTVQFIRVLQQIAIGYLVAFFTLTLDLKKQAACAVGLLGIHTLLHVGYAMAFAGDKPLGDVIWVKNLNGGFVLDQKIHQLFVNLGFSNIMPTSTGGYATTNAISSAATIILGCLIERMFRQGVEVKKQAGILVGLGLCFLVAGFGLSFLIPMVKKIWTASFGIFAAGWTCLIFAFFHYTMEVLGFRKWAFPFQVAGMNSIFLYMSAGILSSPIRNLVMPYTSYSFGRLGDWGPVFLALTVVVCQWVLAYWLYKKKIFFKV